MPGSALCLPSLLPAVVCADCPPLFGVGPALDDAWRLGSPGRMGGVHDHSGQSVCQERPRPAEAASLQVLASGCVHLHSLSHHIQPEAPASPAACCRALSWPPPLLCPTTCLSPSKGWLYAVNLGLIRHQQQTPQLWTPADSLMLTFQCPPAGLWMRG
jgi:hypothetical protein